MVVRIFYYCSLPYLSSVELGFHVGKVKKVKPSSDEREGNRNKKRREETH